MAKILFFGRLREVAGAAERELDVAPALTGVDLIAQLGEAEPELADALADPSVRLVVDHSYAAMSAPLGRAREIAFLPPLSGG